MKNIRFFFLENLQFFVGEIFNIFEYECFRNDCFLRHVCPLISEESDIL